MEEEQKILLIFCDVDDNDCWLAFFDSTRPLCVCLCLWQLVYQIHCNFILFLVHFIDVSAIVQFWSDLFCHWIIWKLSPLSAIFWINSIATVFPLSVQLEPPVSHRISSFPSISTVFVSHIHIHLHI